MDSGHATAQDSRAVLEQLKEKEMQEVELAEQWETDLVAEMGSVLVTVKERLFDLEVVMAEAQRSGPVALPGRTRIRVAELAARLEAASRLADYLSAYLMERDELVKVAARKVAARKEVRHLVESQQTLFGVTDEMDRRG